MMALRGGGQQGLQAIQKQAKGVVWKCFCYHKSVQKVKIKLQ